MAVRALGQEANDPLAARGFLSSLPAEIGRSVNKLLVLFNRWSDGKMNS